MKRTLAAFGAVAALTLSALTTSVTTASAAMPVCTQGVGYVDAAGYATGVPVSDSSSNFCSLRSGNTGNGVRELQKTLNGCYFDGVTYLDEDGQFGPATTKALKRAQTMAGVTADGVYGPNTRDALKWYWSQNWQPRCLRLTQAPGPIR
ncbi:peptidoglycan-binding domain-containing protein [Streptomyces sp. NBC_01006]|uniref:peptidoglycan-binding domain-containing protein n=1 Tax=Streptomyces sp. NBC_01006 TaxID=2903716 RepID=UPI002F91A5CF|nr:peptidoglycan-binding protein [Streptomyces sp. NBC_01006]